MAQLVTGLTLTARYAMDPAARYREGKLFLGVLGLEYHIPYQPFINMPTHTFDIFTLPSVQISPSKLFYNFINRTASQEEFAYSDAVLPTYLRFQPDLREPLNDAAQQILSGSDYMSQILEIDQPTLIISGKEELVRPDGSRDYQNRDVHMTLPLNPPASRTVKLSPELGLISFLARVR